MKLTEVFNENQDVKLIDFGLVRMVDEYVPPLTAVYMPPERWVV